MNRYPSLHTTLALWCQRALKLVIPRGIVKMKGLVTEIVQAMPRDVVILYLHVACGVALNSLARSGSAEGSVTCFLSDTHEKRAELKGAREQVFPLRCPLFTVCRFRTAALALDDFSFGAPVEETLHVGASARWGWLLVVI